MSSPEQDLNDTIAWFKEFVVKHPPPRIPELEEAAREACDAFRRDQVAKEELAHYTRRMLQALDAYWLHYDGLPARPTWPASLSTEEDWWIRFEKYRARVEALL